MATCHCLGETCNCEAIKVPPKLSFLRKHDRSVSGFVAWTAVLNMAIVASLPLVMYAQEPQAVSTSFAPSVVSGVDACVRRCGVEQECLSRCVLSPQLGLPVITPAKLIKETVSPAEKKADADLRLKNALEAQKKLETAKKRTIEFSRNLASIRAKLAQLEKQGMQPPAGLTAALDDGEAVVSRLKSAMSIDDLVRHADTQASMDTVAEKVKASLGTLEKQKDAPEKFMALEQQMRQFDRQLAAIKRVSSGNTEFSERITVIEHALDDLKTAYRQAHDAIMDGDVENGLKQLDSRVPKLIKMYQEAWKELSTTKERK